MPRPWTGVNPNQAPFDIYTVGHVAWGAAMYQMGFRWQYAFGASVLWETVLEPAYKRKLPEIFPEPSQDSMVNKLTDTVAVMLGFWMAHQQKRKKRKR